MGQKIRRKASSFPQSCFRQFPFALIQPALVLVLIGESNAFLKRAHVEHTKEKVSELACAHGLSSLR